MVNPGQTASSGVIWSGVAHTGLLSRVNTVPNKNVEL